MPASSTAPSRSPWRSAASSATRWSTASARCWSPARRSRIAFAGLSLVVLAASPIEVIAGFAMAGIGVATGFPLSATAAAGRGDLPPAVNVAALQVVGVGVPAAPPLIGLPSSTRSGRAPMIVQLGLRLGIAVVLPMIVVRLRAGAGIDAEGDARRKRSDGDARASVFARRG